MKLNKNKMQADEGEINIDAGRVSNSDEKYAAASPSISDDPSDKVECPESEAPVRTDGNATTLVTQGTSMWVYIDDKGEQQGPFTLQDMQNWWSCGMLPPQLKVRQMNEQQLTEVSARPEITTIHTPLHTEQQAAVDYSNYYAHYYGYMNAQGGGTSSGGDTTSTVPSVSDATLPTASIQDSTLPSQTAHSTTTPQPDQLASWFKEDYTQMGTFNARTGGQHNRKNKWCGIILRMINELLVGAGRFQAQRREWEDSAGRQMAHYFDFDAWMQNQQEQKPKIGVSTKGLKKKYKNKKKKKKIPSYLLGD